MSTLRAKTLKEITSGFEVEIADLVGARDDLTALETYVEILQDTSDATKGAVGVGFTRGLPLDGESVGSILSASERNIYEWAHLVVSKPTPSNPNTWDWGPAIQAAINSINALGGGKLKFPRGVFKHSASIQLRSFVSVQGEGTGYDSGTGTVLWYTGTGDGWYTVNTINTSSPMHCHISMLTFYGPSVGLGKGVFADLCGTELHFETVSFLFPATASGTILDQTEISDFIRCQWLAIGVDPAKNGRCVWIVNGPSRVVGVVPFFTNQIKFKYCNFNPHSSGANCVIDDGGLDHEFDGCNWNGGYVQYNGVGVNGIRIIGGEMEAAELASINFSRGPNDYPTPAITIDGIYFLVSGAGVGTNIPAGVSDHIIHRGNVYGGLPGTVSTNFSATSITSYGNVGRDGISQPFNNYSVPATSSTNSLTVSGSTTAGSNTYTSRAADWARGGRAVPYSFGIVATKNVAMAGNVLIGALPFVAQTTIVIPVSMYSGITLTAGYTSLALLINAGSSTMALYQSGSGVAFSPVAVTQLSASFEFYASGTYYTS